MPEAGAHRLAAAVLLLVSALALLPVCVGYASTSYPFYPCSKCHQALQLSGNRKTVEYHAVDLTTGAHAGLYCSSCHIPPLMENLTGGARLRIPGLHSDREVMETNRVCAVCHQREYADYEMLVHGNKTIVCEGGSVDRVQGYKGVTHLLHTCPAGNMKTVPALPCVECHDPHSPEFRALKPLPEPSRRPPPPDETPILQGTLVVVLSGLFLVVSGLVLPGGRAGRG